MRRISELHIPVLKWKENAKTALSWNVSVLTKQFICKAKKFVPLLPKVSTSVQSKRFGDYNNLGASGLPDNLMSENKDGLTERL